MATSVIRSFVAKALFKKKGAIANNKAVNFSANALEKRLISFGIDPNAIRSEQELNQILNLVKQAEDQAFNQQFGNMLAGNRFDKPADVLDMTGKKIDPKKGIMGGKQIDDNLPPPGSRGGPDDIAAPIQSSDESLKSMIEAENKAAAERIRNKKMVKDAVDNMSPTFVKGDRKYNAQMVAEDLAEKRFNKDFYDLDQKQQTDIYGEALDGLDDSDKFAQGGRAGYKFGLGPLFNFLNKKSPAKAYMDYLESVKKRMKAGKEAEVAGEVIPIAAGGALITNQLKKKLKAMNEEQKKEFKKDMEKKADGGRIGYDKGSKLSDFIDIQASGTKSGKKQLQGAPDGITIDSESFNAIAKADIPISQKVDLLLEYKYGKGRNKIERDGQEIFLDEGGSKSRDIGFGFNKDGEGIGGTVMYNMETGKPEFNFGIKKFFADGGRIGLKTGMTKRAFLKLMGGTGAAIGALKSGIFSGFGKGAGKQAAKEVVKKSVSTPPPYFFELANKIKMLGKPDKVTYADRVEIHRYRGKNGDEYELIEDLNTGDVRITKDKTGIGSSGDKTFDTIEDRTVLEYKKGDADVDPESGTAFKSADEYEEYKVEFDADGTPADATELDAVVQKEIIEAATGDAPSIKKAGGGIARMLGE